MTSVELPELTDIREGLSLRRQARITAGEWVRRHAASACLLLPLLALVGAVHAIGMWSFPRWVDDPGTYLSQAWSFQYQRALSPYSYIYDHAPAGWIQLSLWSMLTNGFNRHESAIGFGNECMLIAKLDRLIHHLGSTRSAIVVEPDAVAADCFDARRARLLRRSVKRLADAGHHVYLDAGHARWRSTGETAQRLLVAGIQYAQGFAVNVANRQTTRESYRWGRELSDLVGHREFVIDTSRNGLGPPPEEPDRDDEWCNPRRQGLGQAPTTRTTLPGLAALLWVKLPGESDGICGGETTYLFSPAQARRLMVNSPFVPAGARRPATAVIVVAAPPDVDHPAGGRPLTGRPPEIRPSSL